MDLTFIFLFGLAIGSFLNMAIWRLYKEESFWGRSKCPKCKREISWRDNIPILSFLWLRGKCRHCHKNISIQYPLVELSTGLLFILIYIRIASGYMFYVSGYMPIIELLRNFIFISILIVIFVYDLRWYLILDKVTIPAIIFAFFINILLGFNWLNLIISGIIGGGFFLLQYLISQGKWIGGGDIRLGALMGAMLGYPQILMALFMAYLLGGALATTLLVSRKKHFGDKLPFGTFLALATIISLLYGQPLLNWYTNLIF